MCIFCYYYECLPTFSIYFEFRNRNNYTETIGNFISKPREDRGVLFIHRSYQNYNFEEEYHRSSHPGSIFSNMTAEGMPMWERTRIVVSFEERNLFYTVDNRNFTYYDTINWLVHTLHISGGERVRNLCLRYEAVLANQHCDLLDIPQD